MVVRHFEKLESKGYVGRDVLIAADFINGRIVATFDLARKMGAIRGLPGFRRTLTDKVIVDPIFGPVVKYSGARGAYAFVHSDGIKRTIRIFKDVGKDKAGIDAEVADLKLALEQRGFSSDRMRYDTKTRFWLFRR